MRSHLGRAASSEATSGWVYDRSVQTPPLRRRRAACYLLIHALLVASVALNAVWIRRLLPQRQVAPGGPPGGERGWEGEQEASLGAQRRFAWESFLVREEPVEEASATSGPVIDRRHKPKVVHCPVHPCPSLAVPTPPTHMQEPRLKALPCVVHSIGGTPRAQACTTMIGPWRLPW